MPTSTNTPKRLSDKVKPWVVRAIKKYSTEAVTWEVAVNAFPDPSATVLNGNSTDPSDSVGSLPVLVLFFEIAGPDPTSSIHAAPILPPYALTEEDIDLTVKLTLEGLVAKRQAIIDGEDSFEDDPLYAEFEETELRLIP